MKLYMFKICTKHNSMLIIHKTITHPCCHRLMKYTEVNGTTNCGYLRTERIYHIAVTVK